MNSHLGITEVTAEAERIEESLKMGWIRVRKLGEGGFGFVSLGNLSSSSDSIDLVLENLPGVFAVKSALYRDSRSFESLVFERELLHILHECPSIIQCYGADASEEDDVILYNLFLELAAGGSLVDAIYPGKVRKPMAEKQVKRYTRSILLGLSYMHSKGITHCDIKPANILLVEDQDNGGYIAKIGDLGSAILENRSDVEALIGTLPYLAPESVLHGEYGPAVDIWALGCTVVEMLVGKQLRKFDAKFELSKENLKQMAEQRVEIPLGISMEACLFLIHCLDPNPLLRWDADRLLNETSFLADSDNLVGDESDLDVGDEDYPELLLKRDRDDEDLSDSENWAIYPNFCKKPRLDLKSSFLYCPHEL